MPPIKQMLLSLLRGERRHRQEPVASERRRVRITPKEAHERALRASEDLDRTVRLRREDLLKLSANDVQQTVIFSTYREICEHRLQQGEYRLCRHPLHDAANTGMARCDEKLCPVMLGKIALKGAA